MGLLDEGFDKVGSATSPCVEETQSTLLDVSEEQDLRRFEEQVLSDPLFDGRLDVVDVLHAEIDNGRPVGDL